MTIKISLETISPQYAGTILETHNTNNYRKVKERQVDLYASVMERGEWLPEASTIVIDNNGVLTNGQHRLLAILKSGTAIDMIIVRNADPRSRYVIDDHMPRKMMDHVGCEQYHVSMVNTYLRSKGTNVVKEYKKNVDFFKSLIEGEMGRLTTKLNDLHGSYRDTFTSYGMRAALILSVLSGEILEEEAIELFQKLISFRKARDKKTGELKYIMNASQRAEAQRTMSPLMSKLVDVLDSDNIPVYDGKLHKWVVDKWSAICHPSPKLMYAAYQALHSDTRDNTEFSGFFDPTITKVLGLD